MRIGPARTHQVVALYERQQTPTHAETDITTNPAGFRIAMHALACAGLGLDAEDQVPH